MSIPTPDPNVCPAPPKPTVPAYQASSPSSPLHTDRALYTAIANAEKKSTYKYVVPIRSGHAWVVPKGGVCRLSTPEGAQVCNSSTPGELSSTGGGMRGVSMGHRIQLKGHIR